MQPKCKNLNVLQPKCKNLNVNQVCVMVHLMFQIGNTTQKVNQTESISVLLCLVET
jgi:hypothetical protein